MSTNGSELFLLTGRTVLVTGGTRGIGRAITLRLARSGATVIANYVRNEEAAEAMRAAAVKENLNVGLCRADITTDKGLEKIEHAVRENSGRLSALIHCAATGVHRTFEDLTDKHFDWSMNLNARAFFKLAKLLLGCFARPSSIVAVSSWGASRTLPHYTVVGCSKGALESLARHMAVELAPRGIRVNILTAGAVLTDVWKVLPDSEARIAATVRRTPLGRLVTAEEVACAAQFLCSDAAAGMVGQTVVIDGGAGVVS